MNEELVIMQNGKPMTTSFLVAEKFGKQHKNVLTTIRDIIESAENSAVLSMFTESAYTDDKNRSQPVYIMDRDGFSLLVMGFTGKEALNFKLAFIEAFNRMEKNTLPIPMEPEELLLKSVQLMIEQKKKISAIEARMEKIEAKTETRPDVFTVMGYARLHKVELSLSMAASIGGKATRICKKLNLPIDTVPDPRFGIVNRYPVSVLEEIFSQPRF